ncbi:MAG: MFS transporter, partial [Acidimicrobiia bacterium]
TKRVVVTGMLLFSGGLLVAASVTTVTGYPRIGITMILMGTGMGLAMPPATESIMGSLPKEHAGVGSAVNDTSREVGGALGVAVLGSLVASGFRSSLGNVAHLGAQPNSLADALRDAASLGGRSGSALADAAREAYVNAFGTTLLVGMVVVVIASGLVYWLLRPSATEPVDAVVDTDMPVPAT